MKDTVIFACGTESHILTSFILAITKYRNRYKTLLLIKNNRTLHLINSIQTSDLWDDIYILENEQPIYAYETLLEKVALNASVLHFFSYGYPHLNTLFSYCASNGVPIILTDEGLLTYSPKHRFNLWLEQHPNHSSLAKGFNFQAIDEIWLFNPNLYTESPELKISSIPLIDFYLACQQEPQWKNAFYQLFNVPADINLPIKKMVYFRQYFSMLSILTPEVDAWIDQQVCDHFNPRDLLIKDHPAFVNSLYQYRQDEVFNKNNLPWEILTLLANIEPEKISLPNNYISLSSSAILKSAILGAKGNFIFIYKLIEPYARWHDPTLDGLIAKMGDTFPESNFLVPNSWQELDAQLLDVANRNKFKLHKTYNQNDEIVMLRRTIQDYWQKYFDLETNSKSLETHLHEREEYFVTAQEQVQEAMEQLSILTKTSRNLLKQRNELADTAIRLRKELRSRNNDDLRTCFSYLTTIPKDKNVIEGTFSEMVDIVIPVFNGLQYLKRLVVKLFENTNTPFNLILIDDCSTDPSVRQYLKNLAKTHPNVKFIRNEHNMGFVRTVNLGARFTQNHFVIMNTDVEVPHGWLKRLMNPIIKNSRVASTTPFTNAGTICSFPNIDEDNNLIYNLGLEAIDAAFHWVDPSRATTELPTGVGFCMGINRDVWLNIGPFNEEIFGRGYGEENDWCMRAKYAGYVNVIVPNLFIYHKHGGSFPKAEKQKLMNDNLNYLFRLYPDYPVMVDGFIKNDPLFPIRKIIKLLLLLEANKREIVLIIDHAIGGGANFYRHKQIDDYIKADRLILLLVFDGLSNRLKLTVLSKNDEVEFSLTSPNDLHLLLDHLKINEILYNNLVGYNEPLLVLDTILQLKESTGAYLSLAIHDYFAICPSYNLIDKNGKYCGVPDLRFCLDCLPRNPLAQDLNQINILSWRKFWSRLIESANEIKCFSESSYKILEQAYDIQLEKVSIKPHEPLSKLRKVSINNNSMCIGIIGAINYPKGSQMINEVAKILQNSDPSIQIKLIGRMDIPPEASNISIIGSYDRENLPDILEQNGVNLCFFPSIWPETFSYVVSELMEMEMPICAFDIGAPAERIQKYPLGRLITEIDPYVAATALISFYNSLTRENMVVVEGEKVKI